MYNEGSLSDKDILKKVQQRLARGCLGSGSRVTTTIRNGQVTINGSIEYEIQRRPALRAISSVEGVRGVVDQLRVQPRDTSQRLTNPRARSEWTG
jgi:osmotically-inducible protein OsmY